LEVKVHFCLRPRTPKHIRSRLVTDTSEPVLCYGDNSMVTVLSGIWTSDLSITSATHKPPALPGPKIWRPTLYRRWLSCLSIWKLFDIFVLFKHLQLVDWRPTLFWIIYLHIHTQLVFDSLLFFFLILFSPNNYRLLVPQKQCF
jgi:hypothetical protein